MIYKILDNIWSLFIKSIKTFSIWIKYINCIYNKLEIETIQNERQKQKILTFNLT
jgi:hypothetical protein